MYIILININLLVLWINMNSAFQRDTEVLLAKDSIRNMNTLYDVSLYTKEKKFPTAQDSVDQILDRIRAQLPNSTEDDQQDMEAMVRELQFFKAFLRALQDNTSFVIEFCKDMQKQIESRSKQEISYEYFLRVLLLKICVKLRRGDNITNKQLEGIQQCLEHYPEGKSEILMKLTGCKSYERMQEITYEQINELTQNPVKKAIKFQIAADWKYIVGDKKLAIKMKSQATKIWKSIDKLQRFEQCQEEQKQLVMIISGETINSIYVRKLIFVRQIIEKIRDFRLPESKKKKDALRTASVKFLLPSLLSKLNIIEVSKRNSKSKSKDKNLKSSILKKSSVCEQRKQIGLKFAEHVNQTNYACVEFIPKNKFQTNRHKEFIQILGVFSAVISEKYRDLFQRLKSINAAYQS